MEAVAEFVKRAFKPEKLATKQGVTEFFHQTSAEQFIDLIERYYGVQLGYPTDKRWRKNVGIEDNAYYRGRIPDFIFIPKEMKKTFIAEQFNTIKGLAQDAEKNQETIGRAMYLLTNYSHPLPQFNGRLSRFLYRVISPEIIDKSKAALASADRPEGITEAHTKLNLEILAEMAKDRGITINEALLKEGKYPVELMLPYDSFEFKGLGFIRALDRLPAAEQIKYLHTNEDGRVYIDPNTLPNNITESALPMDARQGVDERVEFARRLMQRALRDRHFGDELFSLLKQ